MTKIKLSKRLENNFNYTTVIALVFTKQIKTRRINKDAWLLSTVEYSNTKENIIQTGYQPNFPQDFYFKTLNVVLICWSTIVIYKDELKIP